MGRNLDKLVFVGFNSRIAALDRETGDICWQWKASKGSGFVSLFVDGDCLFASVQGYSYCLEAETGMERWMNPMKGFGFGVVSIATARGHSGHSTLGQAAADQQSAAHVHTPPPT